MPIPEADHDHVLAAMELFDTELRDSEEWRGWEGKGNYHYALVHAGQRYPVKQIVAEATGANTREFSGGGEANSWLRRHGFEVIDLRAEQEAGETSTSWWWVNQGATYTQERDGGYMWAPKVSKAGYPFAHWTNMTRVQVGDVIIHYANSAIRAVGRVTAPAVDARRPSELSEEMWGDSGYFVKVAYRELPTPLPIGEIPAPWRTRSVGPFTQQGGVKQGYLFPLDPGFVSRLANQFPDQFGNLPRPDPPPNAIGGWLFQGNPAIYDLATELQHKSPGDQDDWSVSRYRDEMQAGQPVVLWQSGPRAGVYAIGEVTGDPFERPTGEFWPDRAERSDLEWAVPFRYTVILAEPIPRAELLQHPVLRNLQVLRVPQGTNFKVTPEEWAALELLIASDEQLHLTPPTLEDLAAETNLDRDVLAEIESLLLEKRQLVFEGPPGSGKTFVAKLFARYFTGNPLHGDRLPDERVELVQFHQSYGYEDFVQGIRPVTDEEGRLQYHVLPGTFMRLCDLATKNPDRRFVLIIDEINRGNLSRIFGELLLLLEYRSERVRLPYGAVTGSTESAHLSIPENLYLIGTMNSTDRSLALIDYALRRRFYFYQFLPVVDGRAPVLEAWLARQGLAAGDHERVLQLFIQLNRRVQRELSSDFQIGHSYFMTHDIATSAGQARVWRYALRPLLVEYFHNVRDAERVLAEFEPDRLLALDEVPAFAPDEV